MQEPEEFTEREKGLANCSSDPGVRMKSAQVDQDMLVIKPELQTKILLITLCYYKSVMYCLFALISIYIENKVLGTFCVLFLFVNILFATGVREQWGGLLQLYQFVYLAICSALTLTMLMQLFMLYMAPERVDLVYFPVWLLLVLPTAIKIRLLQKYIAQISINTIANV